MIDALVSGKLFGAAQSRVSRNGSEFVTAKVRAAAGDGDALFVNVIAFSHSAGAALLALADGDSVALAGTLTPKVWVDKHGEAKPAVDLVAHSVLTAYHVQRKRKAMADTQQSSTTREPAFADDDL